MSLRLVVVRLLSKENRNRLSARGIVVYLETTIEKQLARTNRDKKAPIYCKRMIRVKYWNRSRWMNATHLYKDVADYTVRTDDQSAKVVANQIVKMLEEG